jgi:hypothetical protein
MKIVVSNCRTSLDVVTFRGVPKEAFLAERGDEIELVSRARSRTGCGGPTRRSSARRSPAGAGFGPG